MCVDDRWIWLRRSYGECVWVQAGFRTIVDSALGGDNWGSAGLKSERGREKGQAKGDYGDLAWTVGSERFVSDDWILPPIRGTIAVRGLIRTTEFVLPVIVPQSCATVCPYCSVTWSLSRALLQHCLFFVQSRLHILAEIFSEQMLFLPCKRRANVKGGSYSARDWPMCVCNEKTRGAVQERERLVDNARSLNPNTLFLYWVILSSLRHPSRCV